MASNSELIFGILLPALLSLVALLAAWPPFGPKRSVEGKWWGAPLGLLLASSCAALGLVGFPLGIPPTPTAYLSPYIIAAVAIGFLISRRDHTAAVPTLPLLGAFALLFGLLLAVSINPLLASGSIPDFGEAARIGGAMLLLGLVLAAGALSLGDSPGSGRAKIVPAVVPPLVLFMLTVATSLLLVFSGIISLAILCGALAAALGPAAVGALIRRDLRIGVGVKLAASLILSGLLAQGYLLGEMPIPSAALFALAPSLAAAGSGSFGPRGALFRIFAVSIALGAGLALAAQVYFAEAY